MTMPDVCAVTEPIVCVSANVWTLLTWPVKVSME